MNGSIKKTASKALAIGLSGAMLRSTAAFAESVGFVGEELGSRALREQIGVGEIVFRTGEIGIGSIVATHGLPEGFTVMGSPGQKQLVVHLYHLTIIMARPW